MEFQDYLRDLRNPEKPLAVAELPSLSALEGDRLSQFEAAWAKIDGSRKDSIVSGLVQLAEDSVEFDFDAVYTLGLEDDSAKTRRASLRGLWENDSVGFLTKLLRIATDDRDPSVRAEACLGIGRFALKAALGRLSARQTESVESTLRAVVNDADEMTEVRARALEAAGALTEHWVREAIRNAYEGEDLRLRASAIHAMGRSCEPRWLPLLVRELGSDEAELRYEAAKACGAIGDESAIEPLARLVIDEDAEVRAEAVTALGEIGGSMAKEALMLLLDSVSDATREAAAAALETIDFEEDPLGVKFYG